MTITKQKKLALILPSFSSGGMERVMSQLAWHFGRKEIRVALILLTRSEKFYTVPDNVKVYEPSFNHSKYNRIIFTFLIYKFLRKSLKEIKPEAILSFGGKYNSFVLLAAQGLSIRTFISDRSRPSISYGKFLDLVNSRYYRKASGIIAQTVLAKELLAKRTGHRNIQVIGNPIRNINFNEIYNKEKIILNVGRFISSKKQEWLINYFTELDVDDWQLYFIGEGPKLEDVKNFSATKKRKDQIHFLGNIKNIDEWYLKSSIFAFTSLSEGFPNALGEAMRAGLACISFNCEAGPSDLIDHCKNGVLIEPANHIEFTKNLKLLCENESIRMEYGTAAKIKMRQFNPDTISEAFYKFIFNK
ncbi:MAG: glycosyltransferase [Candidatus Cyclobacteriaceae bacterium M2_1C_046]